MNWLDIYPLVLILAVVLFAGFIQGLVGFGSGLIMVPILVLFLEPKVLVPLVLLHGLIMNGVLSVSSKRSIQPWKIAPILVAALLGIPAGALLLMFLPANLLKIFIGVVIVMFGIFFLSGRSIPVKNETRTSFVVGLISGLLNGSISMSGPPVILFFSNQKVRKGNFRANLVFYFFLLNIFTMLVFFFLGLITSNVLIGAGVLLPAALLGIAIGSLISKKVKEKVFRRIALVLVIFAGGISLGSGLLSILPF